MTTSPQLSVIIPTYNRVALLGKTIESVLDQTFTDHEIIVVDDGSTDRTEEAIEQLLKTRPVRERQVRYFFQRNQGKSVALNRGLSEARGEWIAFLDSDDLWLPDKIEKQFRTLRQYAPQSQACFTDARYINNPAYHDTTFGHAGKRYAEATGRLDDIVAFVANPFGVFMQTILVHSRVMAMVGEFDSALWTGQDLDFVFRLGLHTILCYVNSPLVLIDRAPGHEERLTEVKLRRRYEAIQLRQKMYKKWLGLSTQFGKDLDPAIRGHLRGAYSEQANWLLANRRYGEARRVAAMATRIAFTPGIATKWFLAAVAPTLARSIVLRRARQDNQERALLAMGSVNTRESSLTGNES